MEAKDGSSILASSKQAGMEGIISGEQQAAVLAIVILTNQLRWKRLLPVDIAHIRLPNAAHSC